MAEREGRVVGVIRDGEVVQIVRGPMPGSLLPCGCRIERSGYSIVLCPEHEEDMERG